MTDPETEKRVNLQVSEGLEPLKAVEPIALSRWMDEYFYLSPESSGTSGQWETRPYQRAIADCISLDDIEVLSWKKPGRVGYTKIIVGAMGYNAQHKKRNQVIWQPTDGDAQDFVKDEIDPMLRDCPSVGSILKTDPEKKSKHNTTEKKSFIGSVLDIKGGKSSKNYRRMTKDVAYYDEIDGFDPDIDNQGDATSLGDKRLTQSPFPKSIRGSTPTDGLSQIELSISDADMRFHRFVPCLECGHEQELSWARMKFDKQNPRSHTIHECEACGHGATYSDYPDMDERGKWKAVEFDRDTSGYVPIGPWIDESDPDTIVLRDGDGEELEWPRHAGFWLWGAYSYDQTWPDMADEFVKANQAKKRGAIEKLKTFVNMRLAEIWRDEGETVDENSLFKRREYYAAEVPSGVQYITAWADLQADRIECEVVGWGYGEESWSIDYWRLYGDPTRQELWNAFESNLRRQFQRKDGTLMDIALVGVDSGYLPDEVYRFSNKLGFRWVIPTKGHDERGKPIATFPRKQNAKGVYLTMLGTDTAKELIYQRYTIQDAGPGCYHWPIRDEYDLTYFEQSTAEEKVLKYKRGVAYYEWDAKKRRNEGLDCKVGNLAMIRILQAHGGIEFSEPEPEPEPENTPVSVPPKQTRDTYTKNGVSRRRSSFW